MYFSKWALQSNKNRKCHMFDFRLVSPRSHHISYLQNSTCSSIVHTETYSTTPYHCWPHLQGRVSFWIWLTHTCVFISICTIIFITSKLFQYAQPTLAQRNPARRCSTWANIYYDIHPTVNLSHNCWVLIPALRWLNTRSMPTLGMLLSETDIGPMFSQRQD